MQESQTTREVPHRKRLPVAYFHKQCHMVTAKIHLTYPARSAAVLPFHALDRKNVEEMVAGKVISLYTAESFFQSYQHPEETTMLFTHIGGGIGDVLAFSVIPEFLYPTWIRVHIEERFFPVLRWFASPVTPIPYLDPIVTDFNITNRLGRYRLLRRLPLEYSAIESHDHNWYDGFFQRIGLKEAPEGFTYPHLKKTTRIDSSPSMLPAKSILICHRSSCQMRSSTLEDFYSPVRRVFPNRKIFVHKTDLTTADSTFAKGKSIYILPKCSIHQYLLNLYDAEMVISTDSAAIHFREGIRKPCLAAFGAMTTESRTKYYRYTRSFNVQSDCPHQPCFIHELKKGQLCMNAAEGDRIAKCQSGIRFQEQLYENLKAYWKHE